MSNRFYVNDVQIFGNNEMFKNTYEELKKQGAKWTEDCTFDEIEIEDPQSLLNAVEEDSLEYLKKCLTEDVWDEKKKKFVNKSFSEITDEEILLNSDKKNVIHKLYTEDGGIRKDSWKNLMYWKKCMRVFTALNLYEAIKSEVCFLGDKLVLKDGGKITACMY